MKRTRRGACVKQPEQTSSLPENYLAQLADALRCHSTVIVVDPETCVAADASAHCAQRDVARSLSLIVVLTTPPTSSSLTCGEAGRQCTLRGLGVLDYACSAPAHNGVEGVDVLTFRVVPLSIFVAPWVPHLPPRLRAFVCDGGRFASVAGCYFGRADVGPISEGFLSRQAVALMHGLPRCCVEAVSGHFPLFCVPSCEEAAQERGEGEMRWKLRCGDEVPACTRDAATAAHLAGLAPLREDKLWSVLETILPSPATAAAAMWVVVSYPDGLPAPPRSQCRALSAAPRLTKRRIAAESGAAAAADAGVTVPPAFVLPARFLCQHFRIRAGWQSVAQQHRQAALDAVESLRQLIEAVAFLSSERGAVTATVLCDPVVGVQGPNVALVKASTL